MTVTIKTDNHRRDLVAFVALPDDARADFDYVTGEDQYSPRFVSYLGSWYDTSDTEGFAGNVGIGGWDLYLTDSFFSGVLFRWPTEHYCGRTDFGHVDQRCQRYGRTNCAPEYDSVVVGRYYS